MKISSLIGLIACALLIGSCFMPWAWYPDIEKYFTGFFSEKNYYGKPGLLISAVAVVGIAAYLFRKVWLFRINIIFAGLGLGYAIKTYLLYTSGYDGYVPKAQAGIFIMMAAGLLHVVMAVRCINASGTKAAKAEV